VAYERVKPTKLYLKNTQISIFFKIVPMETELLHADGQADGRTDGHDEANSRLS
jgi:hypothetical protein